MIIRAMFIFGLNPGFLRQVYNRQRELEQDRLDIERIESSERLKRELGWGRLPSR